MRTFAWFSVAALCHFGCGADHIRKPLSFELGHSGRVQLRCGKAVRGKRLRRAKTGGVLLMDTDKGTVHIDEDSIDEVAVYRHAEGGTYGAILGALTGAGLALGALVDDKAPMRDNEGLGVIVLGSALVGGLFGGLIGAGEGSRHVYQYPETGQDCASSIRYGAAAPNPSSPVLSNH